jgi:hypothetical protein
MTSPALEGQKMLENNQPYPFVKPIYTEDSIREIKNISKISVVSLKDDVKVTRVTSDIKKTHES